MSTASEREVAHLLRGERVAFVGKLAGMPKREARQLIRFHAGTPVDRIDGTVSLVVVGEDELPWGDLSAAEELLDDAARQAVRDGKLKVIRETDLWQRLGFVEREPHIRRHYTPAMLADLLGVPVSVIRRWHRKGLIVPAREVRRLAYFDFQEVAAARRLAELLAAGCSPQEIERKLTQLARYLPGVERPLAQYSVIVHGKQLLVREGDELTEPGGQRRLKFATTEDGEESGDREQILPRRTDEPLPAQVESIPLQASAEELLSQALEWEEQGQLDHAEELYRAALAAAGPNVEINFLLAELLYRKGDLSAARERYYVSIELDEDYVEARANLGCVLAEMGQLELAIAALEGALAYHGDYPDVHYHLARLLDRLQRSEEAACHWKAFARLAAESPWAEEARDRLSQLTSPPPYPSGFGDRAGPGGN